MTDQIPGRAPAQSSKSDTEAADWLIRLTEIASTSKNSTAAREEVQDEFNLWATRSPENLRSFVETASVFEALGQCEPEAMRELVAHIDSSGHMLSVIPAGSRVEAEDTSAPIVAVKEIKRSWKGALAAAVLVMTTGGLLWYWASGTTYRTQAGEWRRIRLEDGSVVILSELSELHVSFSSAHRGVSFRGQAVFDVARDARRPFSVSTDTAETLALGTRFEVEHREGPTRVTVIDGAVKVKMASDALLPWQSRLGGAFDATQRDSQSGAMILTKYEGAAIERRGIIKSGKSEVEDIVASQRDELMLNRQPLSAVAMRFNRENRRQLRIEGVAAGQKRISGRYKTDDPEGLVGAIRELFPDLEVREKGDEWVVGKRMEVASR